MTLARIVLQLAQEREPEWLAWLQTWPKKPSQYSLLQVVVVDDCLQCSWRENDVPVEVSWKERELLGVLKNDTGADIAGPLLWRMARMASGPWELDALLRQVVVKETGLPLEPVPFVRRGLEVTSRMDAEVASKGKPSQLVTVLVDQHGTLIKLPLTDPRIRALLDRFLRRCLWTA
jgi:hypothetical protein